MALTICSRTLITILLAGKRFDSNENVFAKTNAYFLGLDQSFSSEKINKLEERWTKCLSLRTTHIIWKPQLLAPVLALPSLTHLTQCHNSFIPTKTHLVEKDKVFWKKKSVIFCVSIGKNPKTNFQLLTCQICTVKKVIKHIFNI